MWNFYLMGNQINCEWVLRVSLFEIASSMALYSLNFSSQKSIETIFHGYIEEHGSYAIEVVIIFVTRR